jgi:cytochrome b561
MASKGIMKSKSYIIDRALHWIAALLLLFMLMNLSTQLHNVDWDIKGQLEHRQSAVEVHATIGVILLVFTTMRLAFPHITKGKIPRVEPRTTKHGVFIKVTHIALYLCIFSLGVTGIVMLNNYEIPLEIYGMDFQESKNSFYQVFPKYHEIHMMLTSTIWWLIGIHFVGIMYAKK